MNYKILSRENMGLKLKRHFSNRKNNDYVSLPILSCLLLFPELAAT